VTRHVVQVTHHRRHVRIAFTGSTSAHGFAATHALRLARPRHALSSTSVLCVVRRPAPRSARRASRQPSTRSTVILSSGVSAPNAGGRYADGGLQPTSSTRTFAGSAGTSVVL
jgi:hypothetical protein